MEKDITLPFCTFLHGINNEKMVEAIGVGSDGKLKFSISGNTDFMAHTRVPEGNRKVVSVLWFDGAAQSIGRPDIIVNCISDADGMEKSLIKTIGYIEDLSKKLPHIPIFNDPRRVSLTRRDAISTGFTNRVPGLIVPLTRRCAPKNRAEVMAFAAREGFKFPYIVRPTGMHNGKSMVRVDGPGHVDELDALPFDGRDFYVIQFHDYKNADGIYRKMRLMVIGGKIYARHAVVSRHWNVHATSRTELMKEDEAQRTEERELLASLNRKIAPETIISLLKVARGIGLDYLGFDCALLPEGKLLCFEINAAMNSMQHTDSKLYPYLRPYTDTIINAYNARLLEKIAEKKNALSA